MVAGMKTTNAFSKDEILNDVMESLGEFGEEHLAKIAMDVLDHDFGDENHLVWDKDLGKFILAPKLPDFGSPRPRTKDWCCSTGVSDPDATRFGFRFYHNYDHERTQEKWVLERSDVSVEFNTLSEAQSWLKGYEYHVVLNNKF